MKLKFILASLASVLAFPAFSADLATPPSHDAPAQGLESRWSGYYAGIHGGWARTKARLTDYSDLVEFEDDFRGEKDWLSDNSYIFGVTAGYNFQRGNWVYGPELEVGYLSGKNQACHEEDCESQVVYKFNNVYGLVAGRIGYATGSALIYGKGGIAFTKISHGGGEMEGDEWDEAIHSTSSRSGLALGGGVEFALNTNTSLKAEYMYMDFGKKTFRAYDDDFATFKAKAHSLKLGINYKF